MADSVAAGLADENETENEDKEREKRLFSGVKKTEKQAAASDLTETLGFYERKAKCKERKSNLTRGYFLEHNEAKYTERRERVYTCLRIPKELEKLMMFGFFLCLDVFLYVFTLLPLRVLLALIRLLTLPCCGLRASICPYCKKSSGSRILQPAQVCDVLKGFIMILCYFMMHYVDYSMMYHLIRGQSVIKLYIIYNMLEVADRLFSSFGQDILDALYWTATEPKERKRAHIGVIPHFFMAVLYVYIKERFTNYTLLLIVCLRNMEQFSWNPDHLWVLFPDVCMVIASEIAVDVVKHAFITKFNDITADAYTDYSDSVSRRMGFIPLPLALLLIRVVTSSVKIQGSLSIVCVVLFYLGMITLKVLNSIVLLGKSCMYVKEANMEEKLFQNPPSAAPSRVSSRAHRTKHTREPPGDPAEEGMSASVTTQPTQRDDCPAPQIPTSESDQFLTTPDESEEKSLIQDDTELKHRAPKKDLLEIDRFTICGNRID
ncbi:hypothetical protein H4Q32_005330 [Labeo rohita]|uniref:Transmembrane anterior posterior transformation 1-like protein n=1 Tax=Labeo rohita TaxID=84645 RepID=A0ABQ8N0J6_LABRO|nr:hypothetical protein H4Q32_005330 [Labeo rohita]